MDVVQKEFNFSEGEVLLIDKPLRWTSFDAVKKIRNAIKIKKVGHAGTLDPLATGLLIICTGKMTKKIDSYQAMEKEYTGTLELGKVTPSYDAETEVSETKSIEGITEEVIKAATRQFIGSIDQTPPAHSAIKIDGKRAYELARKGEEVKIKHRTIQIFEFEITAIELPFVHFRVNCSKGTYIRTLAHDFGKALGCGAYLTALRRTAIGDFRIENAYPLDEFLGILKQSANAHSS